MDRMKSLVESRHDTYGFFAGIFREELTLGQIEELLETGLLDLLGEADCQIDPQFFTEKPLERVEEELACEYAALFIGPGQHVSPYESIYVPDTTGRVGAYWGECTADMKRWVERYGLEIAERFASIPDHISIELEFMQKIIEQENDAWEREDMEAVKRWIEVERTFFNTHLITWVPEFCERAIEAASLDFYREIARLARDFILEEEQLLNDPGLE
ncbi:MAG: molecular chaperone [Dehalococcoidia bacterium]